MQPSAASVICFSWREIGATRGRIIKNGYDDSFADTDDGVGVDERTVDIPAAKIIEYNKRRGESNILHVGGKLSGFKRLVHGDVPGPMRFSYR